MKGKKVIIVILLIVVSIGITINTYKNLEGTKVEEIEEIEEIEETQKNLFAIKVETESGNYEDSTGFPGTGYSLNIPLTKCEDQMGNKVSNVEITGNGTNVTVTSKYNVYCTLYFNKEKTLSQFCNGIDLKTCINSKKDYIGDVANMTTSLVGGMYRYQGIDNVNNYICFGTTDQTTCKNNADKYMYRIIGITPEGELKLMKEVSLLSNFENIYDYKSSSLRTKINGSAFLENEKYMTSTWKGKIMSHTWLYGRTGPVDNVNLYNGNYMYEIESGQKEVTFVYNIGTSEDNQNMHELTMTKKWDESVDDEVGLLYIHDFLFSYPGGDPSTSENAVKSWIKPNNREYFITSYRFDPNAPSDTNSSYFLKSTGIEIAHISVFNYSWSNCVSPYNNCGGCMSPCIRWCNSQSSENISNCNEYCAKSCSCNNICNTLYECDDKIESCNQQYQVYYKPVFYVTSNITLNKGTGSKTDPYILDV